MACRRRARIRRPRRRPGQGTRIPHRTGRGRGRTVPAAGRRRGHRPGAGGRRRPAARRLRRPRPGVGAAQRRRGGRPPRRVASWREVYESVYRDQADSGGFWEDFGIWTSSYDGSPIPLTEMHQWRSAAVAEILRLGPRNVLELGVGNGLILSQVAPHCDTYWGTDFSAAAVESLRARTAERPELAERVELRAQAADDTSGLPEGFFDTVVLNSVAQYFPHADYLARVVRESLRLLAPGGSLFLGDIRNLRLLRHLQAGVVSHRPEAASAPEEARALLEQRIREEEELLLAPDFFVRLGETLEDVGGVEIRLKRAEYANELSRYRYDVVVHKTPSVPQTATGLPELTWEAAGADAEGLSAALRAHPRPDCAWPMCPTPGCAPTSSRCGPWTEAATRPRTPRPAWIRRPCTDSPRRWAWKPSPPGPTPAATTASTQSSGQRAPAPRWPPTAAATPPGPPHRTPTAPPRTGAPSN
ncbi:methyltransferase domain-containing protein [Streptomyces sp. GKU 257-1]|nr:methyltransferase domain-containing protein [Streptomyces sp. GKU 257-1]